MQKDKFMKIFLRITLIITGVSLALVVLPVTLHFGNDRKLSDAYEAAGPERYKAGLHDIAEMPEVHEVYGDEYRLSANIDTIKLIRDDDTFQQLDYNKKCEVITAVLRCEGRYLGLEEFEIEFKDLDDNTLGQFNPGTYCITINAKQIRDGSMPGGRADEVLNTCLHECRHYYQYLMMELYANATPEQRNLYVFTSEDVRSWLENAADYYSVRQNDTDEYIKYVLQPLEVDAREYAKSEVKAYHLAMDNF